jgi:hypothetical protein
LRARRTAVFVAPPLAAILCAFVFGGYAFLLGGAIAFLTAVAVLRDVPCPRCTYPFVGARFSFMPDRCEYCGVREFAVGVQLAAPVESIRQEACEPARWVRRCVAASEILGGVGVSLVTLYAGGLPWYVLAWVEGLALFLLTAGVLLWQNEEQGYRLSRFIQAAQLLQIQGPWITWLCNVGFYATVWGGPDGLNTSAGLGSNIGLGYGQSAPAVVGVNLLAGMWLLVLIGARPAPTPLATAEPLSRADAPVPDTPPAP